MGEISGGDSGVGNWRIDLQQQQQQQQGRSNWWSPEPCQNQQQQQQQPPPPPPEIITPYLSGKRKKPDNLDFLRHKKLDLLRHNLRPIPFARPNGPSPVLHERLLRSLGLWDFLHLNLPADPLRPDLLSPLIASYIPSLRRSYVRGVRISVSRADLARALSLPVKKSLPSDNDPALFAREEAAAVLTGFITRWLVVPEEGSSFPREAVAATKLVKEGHPYKVDWAGLVWTMVEKELLKPRISGHCYYAPHLQRLIKYQVPELFDSSAVRTSSTEDSKDNSNPGYGATVDSLGGCNGGAENSRLKGRKDARSGRCLRRHSSSDAVNKKGDDWGGRVEERPKMEEDNDSYNMLADPLDPSSGDFLAMGTETFEDMEADPGPASSLSFGNICKKDIDAIEDDDTRSFTQGNMQKRARSNGPGFDPYTKMEQLLQMVLVENKQARTNAQMELQSMKNMLQQKDQIIQSLEKARMEEAQKAKIVISEKEQACANAQMELQQKDQIIRSQEKARMEEAQKREIEASQFAHVLRVMTHTIDAYKMDLKEKEEEMRHTTAEAINGFEREWSLKFLERANLIPKLAEKFMELEEHFKLLKETYTKPKVTE